MMENIFAIHSGRHARYIKLFACYKPSGPTSHDVIDEIRKITGVKKVGHAGTLDPLACGVLVVGVGREATKKLNEIVKKEKEYIAVIKLGEESSTDDEEGEKISWKVALPQAGSHRIHRFLSLEEIEKVIEKFVGTIQQVPPAYSAVKIRGRKAYELIRKGVDPELKPRKVEIKEIEILEYAWPLLKIRVVTGPGVYIRALARDIGRQLGAGAYLADLERIRVGKFVKEKALVLKDLKELILGYHKS